MIHRRVSTAFFVDKNNKILLQNRKSISKFGEEWGAFGGSIQEGETPEKALTRELYEELEYRVTDLRLLGEYFVKLGPINASETTYILDFPGFKHLHLNEGNSMRLFTLEDAKRLKVPPRYQQMFEDILNYLH